MTPLSPMHPRPVIVPVQDYTGERSARAYGSTPFQPYVEMSPEADALTFYFKPDADYSQRLTDHVTLPIARIQRTGGLSHQLVTTNTFRI